MSADGLALIDKPKGITSRKITTQVAKIFQEKKAGHLGTLDPIATGVIPILLGKATRLAQFLESDQKLYLAEIKLGIATETMDSEGKIISQAKPPDLSNEQVIWVLKKFEGEIFQTPPAYSAIKLKGKRAYQLARRGEKVELKPRKVKIEKIELKNFNGEVMEILVHCQPGTYLRVIADEIGKEIGCGAHLVGLRRLGSGRFSIAQAISPDELLKEDGFKYLIPLEQILELEVISFGGSQGFKIKDGNPIPLRTIGIKKSLGERFRIFTPNCFAIAEVVEKQGELYLQPLRVFAKD